MIEEIRKRQAEREARGVVPAGASFKRHELTDVQKKEVNELVRSGRVKYRPTLHGVMLILKDEK